jgi:hypothetical protein
MDTYTRIFKNGNVLCMILLIWAFSFALPIMVYLGIGGEILTKRVHEFKQLFFCKGNIQHNEESGTCYFEFTRAMLMVYISIFVLTLIVVVVCYARIFLTLARF